MFDCGCDWPWRGLHRHCNAFAAHSELKCPWCDDVVAGSLSMLIVFGATGLAASRAGAKGTNANARFGFGILAGIVTFHLASRHPRRTHDRLPPAIRVLTARAHVRHPVQP
jgi:hypothetical protein